MSESMNRIQERFEQLRHAGRKALVPFITAGDPGPDATVPLMHAMVEAGVDLIELGVPFSDPMADGPVIQRATERALHRGTRLRDVLDMVRRFRERDPRTPVVLMGYLNPIEVMGYEAFAQAARQAGVDGALTVDLPPEEAEEMVAACRRNRVAPIFLVAPNTAAERLTSIGTVADGFIYYVSRKGVTGVADLDVVEVAERVRRIREAISLPVGVGFGIRDAQSAAQIAGAADAVVVGSALVSLIEAHQEDTVRMQAAVTDLLGQMRAAMDRAAA